MAVKMIVDYVIPCILCEEPLEHVTIYRDEEAGIESSIRARLMHRCAEMAELLREGRSGYPADAPPVAALPAKGVQTT